MARLAFHSKYEHQRIKNAIGNVSRTPMGDFLVEFIIIFLQLTEGLIYYLIQLARAMAWNYKFDELRDL